MKVPEVDKIEDALLTALALIITMNGHISKYTIPEGDILETTIHKLQIALERWHEIEAVRQLLYSNELN